MIDSSQSSSTRPYLIRALYEWCGDNALTPYVAAFVDESVKVPREHVKNNEIVLNISMDATSQLRIGNEYLEFKARFGGVAREIVVPIDHIIAIYARENGQGMAFPMPAVMPAPRHEMSENSAEKRGAGLRAVEGAHAPSVAHAERAALVDPLEAQPVAVGTTNPKIVKLTIASEPGQKADNAPSKGGKGKPAGKPTLTRIK